MYLILIYEFLKIGLFSIGGGLAALPFLYELANKYDWFTEDMLLKMIAISESTPGPIAINMATYSGYSAGGVLGGIAASLALVVPSIFIVLLVIKFLDKFKNNKYVSSIFKGIRPAVTAMIFFAGISMAKFTIINRNVPYFINYKELILFCLIFYLMNNFSKSLIYYICLSAFIGIIFRL